MTPVREFGRRRLVPPLATGDAKAAPTRQARGPSAASELSKEFHRAGGALNLRGASGAFAFSKIATAALIIAAVIGTAWTLSAPGGWNSLRAMIGLSHNGLDFSGLRIGRSATAPVLKLCLTKDILNVDESIDITPDMMLTVLKESVHGRVTKSPGSPKEHAVLELAQMWGQVADCVYHQNAFHLCDIDNRTLAVEAGSIFVRQADRIIAQPETTYAALPGEITALQATRDRVLDAMRSRVRSGVLIASDFRSSIAPPAVSAMLSDTDTVQNDCAKKP
jgi:hypothetical protein